MCRVNRKGTLMSEQDQDFHSFQQNLERIFKDLDDGIMLTAAEIADLRYACGLPALNKPNPVITAVFNDFSNIFGATK